MSLAKSDILSGLDWLEFLPTSPDPSLPGSKDAQIAATRLIGGLLRTIQDRVTTEALKLFVADGTYLQYFGSKGTRMIHFCFLDPKSPLWSRRGRRQFFAILKSAAHSPAVRKDALELLASLSWSQSRQGFAGNPDEFKEILLLPGVARALWAASVAQRAHYRFRQRLIEIRNATLKIGISGNELPTPRWLASRVKELQG